MSCDVKFSISFNVASIIWNSIVPMFPSWFVISLETEKKKKLSIAIAFSTFSKMLEKYI